MFVQILIYDSQILFDNKFLSQVPLPVIIGRGTGNLTSREPHRFQRVMEKILHDPPVFTSILFGPHNISSQLLAFHSESVCCEQSDKTMFTHHTIWSILFTQNFYHPL